MIDSFSPSYFTSAGLPSLYIPSHNNETASQPIDTLDESGLHPNLDIHPRFSDIYITHSDNGIIMPTLTSIEPDLYHIASAPLSALPASAPPTESNYGPATGSQAIDGQSTHKGVRHFPFTLLREVNPKYENQITRRQQNRDAQRRYRERRNKQTKSLEQIVTDLETKCQLLSNGFYQKSQEVIQIFRDNNLLRSEVQGLRQRWQLMIILLQRPRALQSLSLILEEDFECVNDELAPPIKAASLDGLLRSLGFVLSADERLNQRT
ncbi:hypothetical protein BJX62DRAFT_244800 [Aspergillus germanicus]